MTRRGVMSWRTVARAATIFAIWISGCIPHKPPPPPPPPPPVAPPVDKLMSHLLGTWTCTDRGGAGSRLIFEPGGKLTVQGSAPEYTPAYWTLDRARHELQV